MGSHPLRSVVFRILYLLTGSLLLAPAVFAQQPGTLRWRIPIGNAGNSSWTVNSSPAIAADGTIYIANGSFYGTVPLVGRSLYSITPGGHTNWIFNAGNSVNASPVVGPDGTIYIGSIDGNLYAVSPSG